MATLEQLKPQIDGEYFGAYRRDRWHASMLVLRIQGEYYLGDLDGSARPCGDWSEVVREAGDWADADVVDWQRWALR